MPACVPGDCTTLVQSPGTHAGESSSSLFLVAFLAGLVFLEERD
jgi:hypothetical protein